MTSTPAMPLSNDAAPMVKVLLTQKRKIVEGDAQETKKRPMSCVDEDQRVEPCKKAKKSATPTQDTTITSAPSSPNVMPTPETTNPPPTTSEPELDSFFFPDNLKHPSPRTPTAPDLEHDTSCSPEPIPQTCPYPKKPKAPNRISNVRPYNMAITDAIIMAEVDTATPTDVTDKPSSPKISKSSDKKDSVTSFSAPPASAARTTTTTTTTNRGQKKRPLPPPHSTKPSPITTTTTTNPRPHQASRPLLGALLPYLSSTTTKSKPNTFLNGATTRPTDSGPGVRTDTPHPYTTTTDGKKAKKNKMIFAKMGDKRLNGHFEAERKEKKEREERHGKGGNSILRRFGHGGRGIRK